MNETCMKHALNMPIINDCPYCKINSLTTKVAELEQQLAAVNEQLARYAGAVEVEGKAFLMHSWAYVYIPPEFAGQRVRVLVFREGV